jgi:hypothetical protein
MNRRLPFMAQSASYCVARPCPELEVKATCRSNARTSQFDPKRLSRVCPARCSNIDGPLAYSENPGAVSVVDACQP